MSFDKFASEFRQAVEREIASLDLYLGEGKAQSFDEYRKFAGRRSGLAIALGIFQGTIRNYAEFYDDDDE